MSSPEPILELVGDAPQFVDEAELMIRLVDENKEFPKPAVRAFDSTGTLAVYDRQAKAGTLLGLIDPTRWAALLEQRLGLTRLPGFSAHGDGSVMRRVRDYDSDRQAKLAERKATKEARIRELRAEVADIDTELAAR